MGALSHVTNFCSVGTLYVKGAELSPSHFFRSVARAELSIASEYGMGTKHVLKRKHTQNALITV